MRNTLKSVVLAAMVAVSVVFVSTAFAQGKIQPSANYGEGPSTILDLRCFVGFEDLSIIGLPKRKVGTNGFVYDPKKVLVTKIIVGEFWEVHCPEYPSGATEGAEITLSPHTMEITIYWKGGLVVKNIEQLKNVCAVSGGTVTAHQRLRAPFAFKAKMGTKSTRYALHDLAAYDESGELVKLLEEGRKYLIIDNRKFKDFVPKNVEEVKYLGKNPEIKINERGEMGVAFEQLYSTWLIPGSTQLIPDKERDWRVLTQEGVKTIGLVHPFNGRVTIYGSAVYTPAPAPAPAPTPTPTPAPQPLPDSNGNGGDGGGGGCDSGMGFAALLLTPFFKKGKRS